MTVVLANQGSSNEPHVSVRFSLGRSDLGRDDEPGPDDIARPCRLGHASRVTLRVKPSTSYLLTVQVDPPAGQTLTAGTATR